MKAVILAAGLGTRLESKIPKCLLKITDEKTILDFQIKSLSKRIGLENILIVIGFKKELFKKKYPSLGFVYNTLYHKTNTAKSLLVAFKKIDDDVICMNGDVYFDDKILDLIIPSNYSCCLVDNKKCSDEEVKYNLNKSGFINQLSKIVNDPNGESLGIYFFKKNDMILVRNELEKVDDLDYDEKAFENLCVNNKLKMVPIQVKNFFCKEIDFKNDLESVRKHLLGK